MDPLLRRGDLEGCAAIVEKAFRGLPKSPFHVALTLEISNDPKHAASYFDKFYRLESKRYKVAAVYTEMNGFDINPGAWYCDAFAYAKDGDPHDLNWLAYWDNERFREYPILGLEELQTVYATYAYKNKDGYEAEYLCNLVVLNKFQRFMQRAYEKMNYVRVPLHVTMHESSLIATLKTSTSTTPSKKRSGKGR